MKRILELTTSVIAHDYTITATTLIDFFVSYHSLTNLQVLTVVPNQHRTLLYLTVDL